MAKYESQIKLIAAPVEAVYGVLSNLENLRPIIDASTDNPLVAEKIREAGQNPDLLEKLKDVELTSDRIAVPVQMLGTLALNVVEREENKCIKFQTEQSPVDANMWIQVLPSSEITSPDGSQGCKLRLTLKAELNMMMKMMLGNKIEKGIDQFADMLTKLPYATMNQNA